MSFVAKALPFAVFAVLMTACSDVSSAPQVLAAPESALARKGGSGGGGGSDVNITVSPLIVTTRPTVNVSGTWIANTDGPDIPHTYTYTLTQTAAGLVSGVALSDGYGTGFSLVAGTVNGDSLTLYAGAGTVCSGCQLVRFFHGTVSSSSARFDGNFEVGGSRLTFFKQ